MKSVRTGVLTLHDSPFGKYLDNTHHSLRIVKADTLAVSLVIVLEGDQCEDPFLQDS